MMGFFCALKEKGNKYKWGCDQLLVLFQLI